MLLKISLKKNKKKRIIDLQLNSSRLRQIFLNTPDAQTKRRDLMKSNPFSFTQKKDITKDVARNSYTARSS